MAESIKCTAYRNGEPCSLRYDCSLYKNYLQFYSNADMDNMPQKPLTIKVDYENDGKMGKHRCKNFLKK